MIMIERLSKCLVSINFIKITKMGSKLCTNVQTNVASQSRKNSCLEVCYITPTQNDLKQEKQIKPIQFSEVGSDKMSPNKGSQDNCKTTAVNNANSIHHEESPNSEEYFPSPNLKQPSAKSEKFVQVTRFKSEPTELLFINKNREGHLEYFNETHVYSPIPVPFSVIKIVLKPQLTNQINKFHKNFLILHANPQGETFLTWKLLQNGCYLNKISDGSMIIITDEQFYEGYTQGESYKPDGEGMLVTMLGTYKGTFKQGKSDGKGVYISINGNKKVSGFWRNGQLEKGRIETQQYRYEGQFKDSVPHGRGFLRLLRKKIEYTGRFKDGLFDDVEGIYLCPQYAYKGGFKRGRKNGYGRLNPTQRQTKSKNSKRLKGFEGFFENDKFKPQKV